MGKSNLNKKDKVYGSDKVTKFDDFYEFVMCGFLFSAHNYLRSNSNSCNSFFLFRSFCNMDDRCMFSFTCNYCYMGVGFSYYSRNWQNTRVS